MESVTILKLAMLAGEILVESGAETYRVEETMNFILAQSKSEQYNAFAFTTGIFATLSEAGKEAATLIKRIHNRQINLSNIATVNEVSRNFCNQTLSLDEAYRQLNSLKAQAYPQWLIDLGMIALIFGFVLLLGGTLLEAVVALINGVLLALFFRLAQKLRFNPFIRSVLGATLVTVFAGLISKSPLPVVADVITAASMMPLVPGSAITNAIRDTLSGDYMSGSSRALEALVIAASVAIGVVLGLILLGGVV